MAVDILIVEDESDIREILASVIEDEGYIARQAKNSSEALHALHAKKPNLIVLDVWLKNSELDGIGILETVVDMYNDIPVIMISGHGTVDLAVSATKKGAYDFLSKPFKTDALLHAIERGLENNTLKHSNAQLQDKLGLGNARLVGNSDFVRDVESRIAELASQDVPICILGDSGTGKEIVSRQLYAKSHTKGAYMVVDCAVESDIAKTLFGSMSPRVSGAFEHASGGMLVLNKVQNLCETTQLRIAHFLSTGEITTTDGGKIAISTRLVCIAHDAGDFVEALYNKVHHNTIAMVPLHDRPQDIPALVLELMQQRAKIKGCTSLEFSQDALHILQNHHWDGNAWKIISVLDTLLLTLSPSHVVDGAMVEYVLSGNAGDGSLHWDSLLDMDMRDAREAFEKWYLQNQLMRYNGSVRDVATHVRMDRAALSRKIKALNLR